MHEHAIPEDIDERSRWLIRSKTRMLVGRYGFNQSDADDIEQDLIVHLLVSLRDYEPARGARTTFIESVLNKRICNIIRQWRKSGECVCRLRGLSLDQPVCQYADHGPLLGDTISTDLLDSGGTRRTESEHSDLRADISRALAALTPDMRKLCVRLTQASIADIVREDGIPRHRIAWLRLRIRQIFIKFHIDDYR